MRFVGKIGFWCEEKESDTEPSYYDVTNSEIKEKVYKGEIIQYTQRLQLSENNINSDVNFSAQIRINSDLFLRKNWKSVAYVIYNGAKWRPTAINMEFPRVVISLGGRYIDES